MASIIVVTREAWLRLPDFDRLLPAKEGIVANFYTGVIPRTEEVGLEFKGYLEAPREGFYTFSTISDDGSFVFLDEKPPVIEVMGTSTLPEPTPISVRQSLREDEEIGWSRAEGMVTFASDKSGELDLDLSSESGRIARRSDRRFRGVVANLAGPPGTGDGEFAWQPIRRRGQIVAGTLLTPGMHEVGILGAGNPALDRPVNRTR
jgi:hypothetical protein